MHSVAQQAKPLNLHSVQMSTVSLQQVYQMNVIMQLDGLLELVLPSSAVSASAVSLDRLASITYQEGHELVSADRCGVERNAPTHGSTWELVSGTRSRLKAYSEMPVLPCRVCTHFPFLCHFCSLMYLPSATLNLLRVPCTDHLGGNNMKQTHVLSSHAVNVMGNWEEVCDRNIAMLSGQLSAAEPGALRLASSVLSHSQYRSDPSDATGPRRRLGPARHVSIACSFLGRAHKQGQHIRVCYSGVKFD